MTEQQEKQSSTKNIDDILGELKNGARMLSLVEVKTKTSLSRATIYNKIKDGAFPRQYKLGPKCTAWLSSEVDLWLAKRIEQQSSMMH